MTNEHTATERNRIATPLVFTTRTPHLPRGHTGRLKFNFCSAGRAAELAESPADSRPGVLARAHVAVSVSVRHRSAARRTDVCCRANRDCRNRRDRVPHPGAACGERGSADRGSRRDNGVSWPRLRLSHVAAMYITEAYLPAAANGAAHAPTPDATMARSRSVAMLLWISCLILRTSRNGGLRSSESSVVWLWQFPSSDRYKRAVPKNAHELSSPDPDLRQPDLRRLWPGAPAARRLLRKTTTIDDACGVLADRLNVVRVGAASNGVRPSCS